MRFHKNILQLKQVKKYFQQMEVIQLNSNADTGLIKPNNKRTTAKKWYSDLALTYTPAIVFFDEYGQEIIRKDAFFQTFHFQSILSYILDKAYLKQPSFQRYIEEKSDKIRNKGKDVNIWE
ncbi:thioredoxin SoxW [hydrothermal vent metagenome]|uniref:Thioredoxin SoxW n=1 Tax=hydrothermal vent metagenome TaxID=652676 RepID=A0A1W1CCH7_9ZZZZ